MGRRSKFTPAQKQEAVLGVLTKKRTILETCRELGITAQTFARWREQAIEGMREALSDVPESKGRPSEHPPVGRTPHIGGIHANSDP
jgi:transposase-like protein